MYRISRRAEADLTEIYHYTDQTFGDRQARKYLLELDAVFELLGDHPRIGRPYEAGTHQFVHGSHIIIYRIERDGVLIARILHARQRGR